MQHPTRNANTSWYPATNDANCNPVLPEHLMEVKYVIVLLTSMCIIKHPQVIIEDDND